jgi:hypothetical protein
LDTSSSSPPKTGDAGDAGDANDSPTDKFMIGEGAVVSDNPIANGVDMAESSDSANANFDKKMVACKIDTLRVQGQALSSMAQALLMQIEALNTQVGSM